MYSIQQSPIKLTQTIYSNLQAVISHISLPHDYIALFPYNNDAPQDHTIILPFSESVGGDILSFPPSDYDFLHVLNPYGSLVTPPSQSIRDDEGDGSGKHEDCSHIGI